MEKLKEVTNTLLIKLGSIGRMVVVGFAVVGLVAILWMVFRSRLFSFFEQDRYSIQSGDAVVRELRSLNRLETASFTIEKIIDAGTAGNRMQQFLFGDRILLIAHGQVIAGFDLSGMRDEDIRVVDDRITINLPAPQILFTALDSAKTRVYDRQKGILTPGDKDLESAAREEAETQIRQAACSAELFEQAADNAREQLGAIFKAAGFTTVTIAIPEASC